MTLPTTGLVVRLEGDTITTLSDGDPVLSWPNPGSMGDFSSSSGKRPTYVAAGIGEQPSVGFSAASTSRVFVSPFISTNHAVLLFVVKLDASAPSSGQVLASFANNQSERFDLVAREATTGNLGVYDPANGGFTDSGTSLGSDAALVTLVIDNVAKTLAFRVNKVEVKTSTYTTSRQNGSSLYVGAGWDSEPLEGQVAAGLVYTDSFSAVDLAAAESYLVDKYFGGTAPGGTTAPTITAPTSSTTADQSTPVTWTQADAGATFKLELSKDGGSTWSTLKAAMTQKTYSLDTSSFGAGSNYKIRVTATVAGADSSPATSDAFTVAHTAKLAPPTASRNPLRLPVPPKQYSDRDQAETRRVLMTWGQRQDSRTDTAAARASAIQDTDVSTAAPADGQVLTYDSTSEKAEWKDVPDDTINGVDVDDTTPTDGQVLTYDSDTSKAGWADSASTVAGIPVTGTPTDGQVLQYDAATSSLVWVTPSVDATSIDGIPIRHATPSVAYFLRYREASNELVWATEEYAGE